MKNINRIGLEFDECSDTNFAQIYSEYRSLVRSVIFQISGESNLDDLVQDAFVKVLSALHTYRGEAKISSWIYRVSVNIALDHLKSAHQKKASAKDGIDLLIDGAMAPDEAMANRDLVTRGLEFLSGDHRAVLVLALIHEQSLSEIACALELPEGTVKSRLHYAKLEFRKKLLELGVQL